MICIQRKEPEMNGRAMKRLGLICLMVLAAGCMDRSDPITARGNRLAVPSDLRVSGAPLLRVHASGVQIYVLTQNADGNASWKLKAPDATFSGSGIEGRHYAGPTWECTTDGSKVVGRKIAEHPSPDPNAVAWLLLEAKSHEGNGLLSKVTFIQRVQTVGGKAPTTAGAKAGDEVRVQYSADYVFYGPGATTQP
jgi:hypothetical protein